ncbi:MAG: hypothetical protein HY898_27355 [Deltaproteobacteria bacterium]|nr:hypothetical protein [Deltaproteobacteria bacterium]
MARAAHGKWTAKAGFSTGRDHLALTATRDGTVFAVGGSAGYAGKQLSSVEVLRPGADWLVGPELRTARSWAMATTTPDGDVLVFGGLSDLNYLSSVERLARGANAWMKLGEMPYREEVIDVLSMRDGRVLVLSRPTKNNVVQAHATMLDPARGTWSRTASIDKFDLARARAFEGAANTVLVLGALHTVSPPHADGSRVGCDPLRALDVAKGTWKTSSEEFPLCGGIAAATLGDGRVLVAGGYATTGGESSRAFVVDSDGRVKEVASMRIARYGAAAVALGRGRVLVVGASPTTANRGSTAFRTGEIYELASNRWEDAALPTSLEVPHGAPAGEGRAVFVAERSTESWLYDER